MWIETFSSYEESRRYGMFEKGKMKCIWKYFQ